MHSVSDNTSANEPKAYVTGMSLRKELDKGALHISSSDEEDNENDSDYKVYQYALREDQDNSLSSPMHAQIADNNTYTNSNEQ